MDTVYWVCLLVGGFFVALALFGGGDADHDADLSGDHGADLGHALDAPDAGAGFVDLLSLRTLFLFAAFFGLTGVVLSWQAAGEPFTALVSVLMGLIAGLGGSYAIKRIGYAHVSSGVETRDLEGRTARVLLPFGASDRGTIDVVVKGSRMRLVARGFEGADEAFTRGDEVVIVRMDGRVAEVVRPGGALPAGSSGE